MKRATCYHIWGLAVLGLTGLCGCLAIVDDATAKRLAFTRNLPHGDREFVHDYFKFTFARAPIYFYPTVIICAVMGMIGNACFCFFFSNTQSEVYSTKDAMFFRRMCLVDFLVCAVVLPYSVVYESRVITNNRLCKLGEFTRHLVAYVSHLMLTFYSLEFTTKDSSYMAATKRYNRTIKLVLMGSLVLSSPTLIIFEAGNPYSLDDIMEENATLVEPIILFPVPAVGAEAPPLPSGVKPSHRLDYFNPSFCHLTFNFNTKGSYYKLVKNLLTLYNMLNGFLVFLSAFVLVVQVIRLMEARPLLGRSSVFVQVIELKYPDLSDRLQRLSDAKKELRLKKRHARKGDMSNMTLASAHSLNTRDGASAAEDSIVCPVNQKKSSQVERSKGEFPAHRQFREDRLSLAADPAEVNAKLRALLEKPTTRTFVSGPGVDRETGTSIDPIVVPVTPAASIVQSQIPDSSVLESLPEDISLFEYLWSCQVCRTQSRRVRVLAGARHTYRMSVIYLMMVDLFLLCTATVCYLIMDERSFILNLAHVKSVISFFLVSAVHDELHHATWGGACLALPCCRPRQKPAQLARSSV